MLARVPDGGTTRIEARLTSAALGCLGTLAAVAILAVAAKAGQAIEVSQKGRTFTPATLSIHQGDTVTIVNDDADLLHHAYVSSDTFSFDSGDQAPGAKVDVVFSKAGTFTVLCGIHPKMKMVVHVE